MSLGKALTLDELQQVCRVHTHTHTHTHTHIQSRYMMHHFLRQEKALVDGDD